MLFSFHGENQKERRENMLNNMKYLIVVLLVVIAITIFVSGDFNNDSADEQLWLIPELHTEKVNELSKIMIEKAGEKVQLIKQDQNWLVLEKNNFYADLDKLSAMLINIRSAVMIEKKTTNPENFAQLNLTDDDTTVSLFSNEQLLAAFVVGKRASKGNAVFVRKVGEDQAWLASDLKNIDHGVNSWLMSMILNVSAEQIMQVKITKPEQSPMIVLKREPAAQGFVLLDIPEGKQLNPNTSLDVLANGLVSLIVDEAELLDTEQMDLVLNNEYDLFSGLKYLLTVFKNDEQYYLTVKAETVSENASVDTLKEKDDLNKKYSNWMFKIPEYKFNALNKTLDDYIVDEVTVETSTIEDSKE